MIFGIGCDIVNAERLAKDEKFVEHFTKKVLSADEAAVYEKHSFANQRQRTMYLAKRFAAKEAVVKALGTGFRDGLFLQDIEIFNNEFGKPFVRLSANGMSILQQIVKIDCLKAIHLSLSDDFPNAMATVVIEVA